MESEVLMSLAQAADEIGLSERRVRQLVREGTMVADKDGMGRDRLTRAAIDRELMRRGRRPVQSNPAEVPATVADVHALLDVIEANHTEVTNSIGALEATVKAGVEKLSVDRGLLLLMSQQLAEGKS